MDIVNKTLAELSHLFREKKLSSREITDAFIHEIEKHDKKLNCFVTKTFDLAREMADASDSRRKNNKLISPLDGMPITLKDVVCTHGIRTTASSNILKDFVPPYNATVWKKLQDAGVVLLGKTNTDEFTMGASTETSAFGVTRNPHDPTRVAGGSSGGSTAAVAANFCAGSIGTDTGGSIRQPAHFCGVTGLKVTYGRVSRWGTIPMASSLDTVGPIAKTAEDCAMILQTIAGKDELDATTPDQKVPNYLDEIKSKVSGLRIGIPKEYFIDGIDDDVREVVNSAKEILQGLGAEIVNISLPHTKYAVPTYYIIAPCEISANMARFDGIRFGSGKHEKTIEEIYTQTRESGLGDEVKRRILIGTYALSAGYYDAFYRKAQKVRTLIKQDFDKAFEKVDAILTPVAPTPAFKIGKNTTDPLRMYLEDIFTIAASLAGICGISLPMGKSEVGELPIGIQILGPAFHEGRVLRIAHQIQKTIQTGSYSSLTVLS
ncbi:Asp-tRNA(Asn)/Glu-tRNA(Gln) amidotransferase subunit GatA [Candidatus Gracilibacteria bacterium]|nr:Asp-tRNA(Asn)/Glu-tRNA(Gln) amidotransferase subunit GatA [Candidatus Gracilibacteria bacterium]